MNHKSKSNLDYDLAQLQALAKERTVKTQNIEYDLETLIKKISNNMIKLNPDYQRNHRWTDITSSRLIESLILNIPIPTVFLSQDVDVDDDVDEDVSRFSVIDGQQRLTAIHRFMSDGFPLVGLNVLEPLNGSYYRDLPPFLVRRLEERTIKCLRVDSTLDMQVKYDIFERLNTGAVQLESQELRNAIFRGPFNDMIKEMAKEPLILSIMNIDPNNASENGKVKKMDPEELILRFFSLYNDGIANMKKSLKDFLSEQMQNFNDFPEKKLQEMREHFNLVLNTVTAEIHSKPFTKYIQNDNGKLERTPRFNYSVFDALAIGVSDNLLKGSLLITEQGKEAFKELFLADEFKSSISSSTTDKSKIEYRIAQVSKVFSK